MPEGLEHSGLCCGFVATDPSFPARYPKGLSSLDPSPAGPGGNWCFPLLHPRIWDCHRRRRTGAGTSRHGNWAFPKIFNGNAGVGGVSVPPWITPGSDPTLIWGLLRDPHPRVTPLSSGSALKKGGEREFLGLERPGLAGGAERAAPAPLPEDFPAERSCGRSPGPGELPGP